MSDGLGMIAERAQNIVVPMFNRKGDIIIIIMVIFKCYFSGELIALT